MRKTRLNPISRKQAIKNLIWREITAKLCEELGYFCQWCGWKGQRYYPDELSYLDGHHIIKRRFNIHTKENCYICHRKCHGFIEDKNINVLEIPNLATYKEVNNEQAN